MSACNHQVNVYITCEKCGKLMEGKADDNHETLDYSCPHTDIHVEFELMDDEPVEEDEEWLQ